MVKNIFSLLASRQTSILSGATIIMLTVVLAKLLGLARDRLLVNYFAPDQVAVFFAAFRIPDLVFQLLIFGALSVAFIPVFTESLEEKGQKEAFNLARSILIVSLLLLSAITIIIYIFADGLTELIVPGFTVSQKLQAAQLTRIILIGQLILTVGSFFVGVLQSFQRFIVPAMAGVMYNFGIILGIVFLSQKYGITGAAVGVIIGAFLHVLVQLPLVLSLGFRPSLSVNLFHSGTKEIIRLMSVRTIGLAAEQINDTIGVILASLISTASVTYLTFAQHLQMVPVGLFGATIAQAALPVLSAERARGKPEEFKITLLTTLHQMLFLSLPATAILIVLRIPAVRLTFGASQFDWASTVLTGQTVAMMAIGLSAQAISLLLVRAFYAMKDTKTPVIISLVTVALNIFLSVYFTQYLQYDVWGLGLAFSISSITSGIMLFASLHKKIGGFDLNMAFVPFGKMLLATVIMGSALYVPIKLLDQVIFDTTKTINLFFLTGFASLFALSIYVLLVWFMKVRELQTYIELFKRHKKVQEIARTEEIIHE